MRVISLEEYPSAPVPAHPRPAARGLRRAGRTASLPPLDELVLTILSQNTSDLNSERAYAAMRERYPRWQDVLERRPAELVEVLRPGGLANQKAPRIQAMLRELAASPARARPGLAGATCGRRRRWRS